MFSKSNLVSTLVGGLWMYFGGYLLWDIIGSNLFENPGSAEADQMHLIIACIITAFVYATIYSKWSGGDHSLKNGANLGCWVGVLLGFGERWYDVAFGMQESMQDAVINGVLNVVGGIVLGVLVSLVYGKLSGGASE